MSVEEEPGASIATSAGARAAAAAAVFCLMVCNGGKKCACSAAEESVSRVLDPGSDLDENLHTVRPVSGVRARVAWCAWCAW